MTDIQAIELIETVFAAHWPNWSFTPDETEVWVKNLRRYDFVRAKTAINNYYMSQTRQGKPAPGNLLNALRKNAATHLDRKANEPIKLFEIITEGKERGQGFFATPPLPAEQEIEDSAERYRKNFNVLYNVNHIVLRCWEQRQEKEKEGSVLIGPERKAAINNCIAAAASGFVDKVPF